MLLAGRAILGVSLGISGVCGPTLVAEATPGRIHALMANLSMLGLPLVGVIVSAGGIGVYKSDSDWGWRGIILGEAIPPMLSSLCLLFAPESPRWLLFKNRPKEARQVLEQLHSAEEIGRDDFVLAEFEEAAQTIEFERHNDENFLALVAKPSDRRRFLIAVLTNIFYQTSGANTLPYFFTLVLTSIGITDTYTLLYLNLGLTAWGVCSLASGLWITYRFGSKTIMLTNTTLMTICLALLAILTALGPGEGRGHGALVATFLFWWASCSCWMILEYTYPVEVLRFSLRGKGSGLAQLIGYAFQLTLNYTLPMALERIGWKFYVINAVSTRAKLKMTSRSNLDSPGMLSLLYAYGSCSSRSKASRRFCPHWLPQLTLATGKTLEEVDAIFDGTVHFHIPQRTDVIEGIGKESPPPTFKGIAEDKA